MKPKSTPKGQKSIASFFFNAGKKSPSAQASKPDAPSPLTDSAGAKPDQPTDAAIGAPSGVKRPAPGDAPPPSWVQKRACIDRSIEPSISPSAELAAASLRSANPINPTQYPPNQAPSPLGARDAGRTGGAPNAVDPSVPAGLPAGSRQPTPAAASVKAATRDDYIPARAPKRHSLARRKLVERYELDMDSKGGSQRAGGQGHQGPLSFSAAAAMVAAASKGKSQFTPLELQVRAPPRTWPSDFPESPIM